MNTIFTTVVAVAYWVINIASVALIISIVMDYEKLVYKNKILTYIALSLLSIIVAIGPLNRIMDTITETNKNDSIQESVEIETNTDLPDGIYYLGVELVSSETFVADDMEYHHYEFGVIDCENRSDMYSYDTLEVLDPEVPYMLTMDSMGTKGYEDDEIITVWRCVD